MNLSNKVYKIFGKIKLEEYVEDWKKNLKKIGYLLFTMIFN